MISPKKLMKMARKWHKVAAMGRKRIPSTTRNNCGDKGHFVVYTTDKRRFSFPIGNLNNDMFRGLLNMSEQEFGLPRDGPITVPCDAAALEYVVWLMRQGVDGEVQRALLVSLPTTKCPFSSLFVSQEQVALPPLVCGYS